MKFSFCLLLALIPTGQAFAQPQGPGTNPIFRIDTGGNVRFGSGGQTDTRSWRERTDEAADFNRRNSPEGNANRYQAPCTPVQPGSSNMVLNPCPAGAAPLPAANWALPANSCNVTYTGISEVTYAPENLKSIVLKGQHNAPSGQASESFEVMDIDGFLTLAALHSTWQSNLLLLGNSAGLTSLPLADIRSARTVITMGLRYHEVMVARIEASNDPAMRVHLPKIFEKKNFLLSLDVELAKWQQKPGEVPVSRIRDVLSKGLEKFAPSTPEDERLLSQYRDLSVNDRPHILCNPNSESEMVGQVVCSRNFVDGRQRNTSFCPGGISFNNLSSLPVCVVQAGVTGACRASLYAQSPGTQPGVSAPAVTPQAGAR